MVAKLTRSLRLVFVGAGCLTAGFTLATFTRKGTPGYLTKEVPQKFGQIQNEFKTLVATKLVSYCAKWSRHDIFHSLRIPWLLVQVSNSKVEFLHDTGVKALSVTHFKSNSSVQRLKAKCKFHTLVSLARTPGTYPGWFLFKLEDRNITSLHYTDLNLETQLEALLRHLRSKSSHSCTLWMVNKSVQLATEDVGTEPKDCRIFWSFSDDTLLDSQPPKISEEQKWTYYLDCLKHATSDADDCLTLLHKDVLNILRQVISMWDGNNNILALCGDIVANLSLIEEAHGDLFQSGFIEIARLWMSSSSSALSSAGVRVLHNLDSFDAFHCRLLDGVHLVHPLCKGNPKECELDVVFVHGLSGGPFRTWRQKYNSDVHRSSASDCWPKDWLPKDFPSTRVFCVGYDTHLTKWTVSCPYTSETHSLNARSRELALKLKEAGVGKRPIVWVTHSMGGLVVKDMLVNSYLGKQSDQSLVTNTCGVVFFSVPHRGSPLAKTVTQAKYIAFPSVEVHDLRQNSQDLLELHDNFLQLIKNHKAKVLSFIEMKPLMIPVLKLKLKIVPQFSANINHGKMIEVYDNHVYICKPERKSDIVYSEVISFIRKCMLETKSQVTSCHVANS